MKGYIATIAVPLIAGCALGAAACSSSSSPGSKTDAGGDGGTSDARADATGDHDGSKPVHDGAAEATVTGLSIVVAEDAALQAAPGDALRLEVQLKLSDGTTTLASFSDITWTEPVTITAQDPDVDGSVDVIPEAGATPTAFFVNNAYRASPNNVLFVVDPGTTTPASVTVKATVTGAGDVSANVAILPTPTGDAAHGQMLFQSVIVPVCASCHGMTAAGSPPVDGGEAGIEYQLPSGSGGELYPYPAPGLNDAPKSGNLADDPTWSAALLGMAAQGDVDNNGVALRAPMPIFLGTSDGTGKALGAQDFADIYAWLKTQKH